MRQRLDRCAAAQFELDCSPVRNFPSFRGQRNYPGLWWFATTGTHVGHESWVERDQLMALDADPDVVGVLSQPFWIHWPDGTRHAPDYFVRRRDGSVVVVDVREDDRISGTDREVFDRSAATCETVGWDYCRVGALDPVLRANLRWLSGYRQPRALRIRLADRLAEVFTQSGPLMAGVLAVGTPLVVPNLRGCCANPSQNGVLESSQVFNPTPIVSTERSDAGPACAAVCARHRR